MNKLNAAAFILVVVLVVLRITGKATGLIVSQWDLVNGLTASELEQWIWTVRVLPVFAVHFGIALWLQDRAMADRRERPMLWGIFGLCFGLVSGVIYAACAIMDRKQQAS